MSLEKLIALPVRRRSAPQLTAATLFAWLWLIPTPASADLVVSQLIVEFKPGSAKAADIEVSNNADERAYAVVEPREILNPGTTAEQPSATPDPAKLGLIASPARFILEPRQRRMIRIAAIGGPPERERVYRVTVKPVTGEVAGSDTGLKLLVGYDLLVLVRPAVVREELKIDRESNHLVITNLGNASVELSEGQQCLEGQQACQSLPGKRLYAGVSWKQPLPGRGSGEYRVRSAAGWSTLKF